MLSVYNIGQSVEEFHWGVCCVQGGGRRFYFLTCILRCEARKNTNVLTWPRETFGSQKHRNFRTCFGSPITPKRGILAKQQFKEDSILRPGYHNLIIQSSDMVENHD